MSKLIVVVAVRLQSEGLPFSGRASGETFEFETVHKGRTVRVKTTKPGRYGEKPVLLFAEGGSRGLGRHLATFVNGLDDMAAADKLVAAIVKVADAVEEEERRPAVRMKGVMAVAA